MTTPAIQTAFHSGELAPSLQARVDLAKYHSAAALLSNFYVDYRGGASTRAGTKYILQAYKSATAVRLIPFSASFTVSYVMEFGDRYIRFYSNGGVVLEATTAITGVTNANPGVITDVGHGYSTGDWVFLANIGGTTQLNGKYYIVVKIGANSYSLTDLNGVPIDTTAFGVYTAGGTAARVYTLPTPYTAADLANLKFAQSVNSMVFCHPSYQPYVLTLISSANWTLQPILFGSTISPPTGVGIATTLGAGSVNYAYVVTAVDINGQESSVSAVVNLAAKLDLLTTAGTNTISWSALTGAVSYNIYKTTRSYAGAVPSGVTFGFIGSAAGTSFIDTSPGIDPDFSTTPPIVENPFQGGVVASVTVTAPGAYTTVPGVTFDAAPAGGATATGHATLQAQGTAAVVSGGIGLSTFNVGDIVWANGGVGGLALVVASVVANKITSVQPFSFPGANPGAISGVGTATPSNPVTLQKVGGTATATFNITWGVFSVGLDSAGAGYTVAPAVTFSAGAATATSVLGPTSAGNPSVPSYYQQRLVLAAPTGAPQTFYMSQPGSPYNFNISDPTESDDAITGSIISGQLNTIQSMIPMPSGLILLSSRSAWQVNGGNGGAAISPINATAQTQAYNGSSNVPPIVANYDILYVQAKGSIVRDLTYNFYTNIYTGTDISVLSSHLFYGYTLNEWAFCEEPFKTVWVVRNDGTLLTLTFLKEQEIVGWAHSNTLGDFKSVATITENVAVGNVDALYVVVTRNINGNLVKYIERMVERYFPNGPSDAWCVDAGLQYNGAPATNFTGADHLAGTTVTGLADGVPISPFVMPLTGNFVLPVAASKVTVGLGYTCLLRTLRIDLGEPTVQGKRKKITAVTVRVADTAGIKIGTSIAPDNTITMKDFNVSTLVTGDGRSLIPPIWDTDGDYYITQTLPLPASILGVIPEITQGDTK